MRRWVTSDKEAETAKSSALERRDLKMTAEKTGETSNGRDALRTRIFIYTALV